MSDDDITEVHLTPGQILQSAREAKGLSVDEVSDKLHILPSNLRAIEEDRFEDVLKGATFVRGYLRRYAALLGLDGEQLVAVYNRDFAPPETKVAGHVVKKPGRLAYAALSMPSKRSRKRFIPLILGVLVVVLLLAVIATAVRQGWFDGLLGAETGGSSAQPALINLPDEQPVPELVDPELEIEKVEGDSRVLESTVNNGITVEDSYSTNERTSVDEKSLADERPAAVAEAITASLNNTLEFELTGDSWIEVRDSQGKRLYADLARKGKSFKIEGDSPFNIIIGDGRGVTMRYNGRSMNYSYAKNGYAELTVP